MTNNEDDYSNISPKYIMELIPKIETVLWALFETSKYKKVKQYILKWHIVEQDFNYWENFKVFFTNKTDEAIDLSETLSQMPNELVIKIAIDLGIDTPGFLPMVGQFKNILKDTNDNAYKSFERAINNTQENPDEAISLANAALEGIIKTILSHDQFSDLKFNSRDTLYKLTEEVLKRFKMYPGAQQEVREIQNIGNGLLRACQNIEILRSTKTKSHGKSETDYIITESLWAAFIVNSVATIGVFLTEFFDKKYEIPLKQNLIDNEQADNIPF